MNQKSGQNSLGLDNCFEDEANPIDLFKKWFDKDKSMARHMSVEVYERRVLLTGIAKTDEERALAVGLAWKVNGVQNVINEISIRKIFIFILD